MNKKIRYCHICHKPVKGGSHWRLHKDKNLQELKVNFYKFNFPKIANADILRQMYVDEKQSLPMLCKYAGDIDLKAMSFMLNYYGIQCRSIKTALNLPETKSRFIQSCLKKYGTTNTLSKGTPGYLKRNQTVIDKYGVENVFQLIDDFMKEHGTKYNRSKISSLNVKIQKLLDKNNIQYKTEFKLSYKNEQNKKRYKFYDFHIIGTNILLEINGDYWHANPNKYKSTDTFQFPRNLLTAQDIWNMDNFKKYIAEVNNYQVEYIWESDIKGQTDEAIIEKIKNYINRKA